MKVAQKIFALFLLLLGSAWLVQGFIFAGLVIFISGLIVIPGVLNKILGLFGKGDNMLLNFGIKAGLIMFGVVIVYISQMQDNQQGERIFQRAKTAISRDSIDKALSYINDAKELFRSSDNSAVELEKMIQKLNSKEFLKEQLISITDEQAKALKNGKKGFEFLENPTLNEKFISKVRDNIDERPPFVKEKLVEVADSSLENYLRKTLINLNQEKFEKLKSGDLDTTFIESYPPVNSLFVSKLESVAHKRQAYLQNKLNEIADGNTRAFMMNILGKLDDEQYEQLKKGVLDTTILQNPTVNSYLLTQLRQNKHLRSEYQQKQKEKRRKQKIKSQFSEWDGSHRNLKRYLKKNLHDASSFEHVKTTYSDKKNYLLVRMKYRANNKLGAKILKTITAKVSLDGEVLEVISHQ